MTNPNHNEPENILPDDEMVTPEMDEHEAAAAELEDEEFLEDYQDAASEYESAAETSPMAEVDSLKAELADAKDKMMRALADAENTRRRAERTAEDSRKYAVSAFAKDMLDVADNLRRALDAVSDEMKANNQELANILQGVEVTERGLQKTFEKHGIQKIEPSEGPFDPSMHEVMFEAEGTGKPAGEIVQLLEAGYLLNGRLIRPARVGVAKADPNAPKAVDEQV
jgi:molecular chaperone GrpE